MAELSQPIDSAAGLAKSRQLFGGNLQKAPALEPPFPFTVLTFFPGFYGTPQSIVAEDFKQE